MKKGYDPQVIQPYEGGMTRRNFLRFAGLAGATAGLAITGLGCLPVYDLSQRSGPFFTKPVVDTIPTGTIGAIRQSPRWEDIPHSYYKIELDEIDKKNLKITDFVLKKDELEGRGIRLARGREKSLVQLEELNPLISKDVERYPFKSDSFPELNPVEWIAADYIEQIDYPHHRMNISASRSNKKEVWEKIRTICKESSSKSSKNVGLRIYGKFPFIVNLMSLNVHNKEKPFLDKNHEQEHIERAEAYAEKRGLEFVAGTY
jgi:hypothetical protein